MSSKMKVVVYWPDTEQVSTEDLAIINEEDRYQEAVTIVKLGNRFHKGVVRLISSDNLKLAAEEQKVDGEIEARLQAKEAELQKAGGRGSRKRSQTQNQGAASGNQVAAACGEKLRPTPDQAPKVKQLAKDKKTAAAAQKSAHDDVDRAALGEFKEIQTKEKACRTLEFSGEDNNTGLLLESENEGSQSEDDKSVVEYNTDEEVGAQLLDTSECCIHCCTLRKACNQSPALFVRALSKFTGMSCASTHYIEVLDVPPGVNRSELSKGSKVYLSTADKNGIKREGGGDPAKMTRLGLLALFGRDNMEREQVTAKGQKAGSKGIRKNVRDALLAFVNRNKGHSFKDLDETRFNQVINKKKNSIHRVRKSPTSAGKPKKAPAKPPKITPAETIRDSPTSKTPAVRQSPFYEASPLKRRQSPFSGKSPLKVIQSPKKAGWEVTHINSSAGVNATTSIPWGPAPSNYQHFQGINSSGMYYQQPEHSNAYNTSYPVGQGNYSSEPETWYQNFGSYGGQ